MTSHLLSCWHLKSYRERLGMNCMIFVYLRLREDSITNEQWYFAMLNITRGWIHVRDDRFSKFRNRKNHLVSDVMMNWHTQRVYLRLREDSITNEQWYFAMLNITRGWIHVRDDRFSKFRNRKNHLVSDVMMNWHTQRARRKMSLIPAALPNVLRVMTVMACRWIVGIVKI